MKIKEYGEKIKKNHAVWKREGELLRIEFEKWKQQIKDTAKYKIGQIVKRVDTLEKGYVKSIHITDNLGYTLHLNHDFQDYYIAYVVGLIREGLQHETFVISNKPIIEEKLEAVE